jgi:phosphonate transport system ATP-binding protein
MFRLENATIAYNGAKVLENVSLHIRQGERVALVGRSGAGKSTLLKLLFEQRGADTAIIPQELGLVRPLSLFHNVYMGRLNVHPTWYNLVNLIRPRRCEVDAIREVAERLELHEDKLFEPVGQLSGGQQQRTAVARAIHQHGKVVLADEPVSSVDGRQSRIVLENLNAAHDTVVLTMHDVDLAIAYTDRIIGLQNGQIIFDESTAQLSTSDLDFLYH